MLWDSQKHDRDEFPMGHWAEGGQLASSWGRVEDDTVSDVTSWIISAAPFGLEKQPYTLHPTHCPLLFLQWDDVPAISKQPMECGGVQG